MSVIVLPLWQMNSELSLIDFFFDELHLFFENRFNFNRSQFGEQQPSQRSRGGHLYVTVANAFRMAVLDRFQQLSKVEAGRVSPKPARQA